MNPQQAITQLDDAREDTRDAADVVVIGTGAAGGIAAKVLAEAGLDVVILEEGPFVPPEEFRRDVWSAFKNLWRDAGFQVADGRSFLPILQGCAVGGSTVVNGAIVHRLPEAIHAGWARDHGADTLLSLAALERAYDTLDAWLGTAPAPESVLGENNRRMRAGAEAMGIRSNAILRNVRGCEGSCGCLQGCRNARKQSTNFTAIPDALAAGARLYATCRAERFDHKRGRVTHVRGRFRDPRDGRKGRRIRVEARHAVVVAASAIQTPLLLADNGIGRRHGVVGSRFQCHPGSGLIGVFDDPVDIHFGATQAYETTHWWDERMKFETVGAPPEVLTSRLPGFGPELMRRVDDYGHLTSMGVQIRAHGKGTVKRGLFGRTVIHWDFTDEDVRNLKLGLKRLATLIFEAGAREILPGIHGIPDTIDNPNALSALDDLPDDPRLFHGIASHMFGTAVMGPDVRTSVVSPELECHELHGVYVVDSSVFPTNMGVNPAHTISAVGLLAAERIAERVTDARG